MMRYGIRRVPPNGLPWKERDEDNSAEGISSLYKVDETDVQGGRPMRKSDRIKGTRNHVRIRVSWRLIV
jgi:hypothetical protein